MPSELEKSPSIAEIPGAQQSHGEPDGLGHPGEPGNEFQGTASRREMSRVGISIAGILGVLALISMGGRLQSILTFGIPFATASIGLGVRSVRCFPATRSRTRLPFIRGLSVLLGGILTGWIPLQTVMLVGVSGRMGGGGVPTTAFLVPLFILGMPGILLLWLGFRDPHENNRRVNRVALLMLAVLSLSTLLLCIVYSRHSPRCQWPRDTGYVSPAKNRPASPIGEAMMVGEYTKAVICKVTADGGVELAAESQVGINNGEMQLFAPGAVITYAAPTPPVFRRKDLNGDECLIPTGMTVRLDEYGQFIPLKYVPASKE